MRGCGGDEAAWRCRWQALADQLARQKTADGGDPQPYQGLLSFEVADAGRFFGRQRQVGELLRLVSQRRFVAVVGASGSGKSSLLRAGLVAGLGTGVVMVPGARPVAELRRLLATMIVQLWNVADGILLRTISGIMDLVGFDPTGHTLIGDPIANRWDVATGTQLRAKYRNVTATDDQVLHLPSMITPDERILVIVTDSSKVYACDADHQTMRVLFHTTPGVTAAALNPSGTEVALTHDDGTAELWSVRTRTRVATFPGTGVRTTLAFSPNGRLLATAGQGPTIEVWSMTTHQRWATLTGTTAQINRLAWGPDSRTIYATDSDHTITTWSIDPAAAARHISERLTVDYPSR